MTNPPMVLGPEEERALEMGISAGLGKASWVIGVCLQRKDNTGEGYRQADSCIV